MPDRAYMLIAHELVDVILSPRKGSKDDKMLKLSMTLKYLDWYLTRVYYPSSSPSPHHPIESTRQRIRATTMDRGRTHWLDLLRFFPATANLYLYTRIGSRIVFARPTRARPGRSDRSVAGASKSFHRASLVILACRRCHWEVCCRETGLRSPRSCPSLRTRTCPVSVVGDR